ncbi:MAG: hypothetical protein IIA85_00835 [Nanoarchaeota archaeon]|nr:hypothetical protein [Nanoarchaeota archaeon]
MFKFREFLLIIFGIFTLLILIYGFAFFDKGITGMASLELESIYEEGQTLEGLLKISLREGELIPSDSKVVFENAGQSYEYNLNEVISDKLTSGNFYVEGANLSGKGDGFGVKGKKTIYPKVYFKLNIFSVEKNLGLDSEEPIANKTNSSETPEEISGEVFADNDFSYDLETGQSAELLPESVKTDNKNLEDSEIHLIIEGDKVLVSTNYSETEEGFGEDYLGESMKVLLINLSAFGFKGESGELKVSLIHNNEEIILLTTTLNAGTSIPTIPEIIPTIPKTNVNNFEDTKEKSVVLSMEEKDILVKEFGNQSIKITNAEKTSEDIVVRFEIEDYWVEHHYDPLTSNESLELKVEEDRIRFLKDLANKFSEEEINREKIGGLIRYYEI